MGLSNNRTSKNLLDLAYEAKRLISPDYAFEIGETKKGV